MRTIARALLVALVTILPMCAARAAEPPSPSVAPGEPHPWRFSLSLPVWFVETSSTFAAPGVPETSAESSVSDVFGHPNIAFGGRFEAKSARWGAGARLDYMSLKSGSPLGPDTTLRELIPEAYGFYRIIQSENDDYPGYADVLVGARVGFMKSAFPGGSSSYTIPMAVVGLRNCTPIAPHLGLALHADTGLSPTTFGYDLIGDFLWQFSRAWELGGGYRYMYVDFSTAEGPGHKLWRTTNQGAYFELSYSW